MVEAYTDGSFFRRIPIWAFVVVKGGRRVASDGGTLGGPVCDMQQIGGELFAVMQALAWAKKNNQPVWIVHDYEGVRQWVADLWHEKPWQRNNRWSREYRRYIFANRAWLAGMRSVRSHTGIHWNEVVDKEARAVVEAAGLVNHHVW